MVASAIVLHLTIRWWNDIQKIPAICFINIILISYIIHTYIFKTAVVHKEANVVDVNKA